MFLLPREKAGPGGRALGLGKEKLRLNLTLPRTSCEILSMPSPFKAGISHIINENSITKSYGGRGGELHEALFGIAQCIAGEDRPLMV